MFGKNLAGWDRWARFALGAGVLSLAFWGPRTPWGWAGAVLIGTSFLGHCPIYAMFRVSTCDSRARNPKP
jgi:hypothetical protein